MKFSAALKDEAPRFLFFFYFKIPLTFPEIFGIMYIE